MSNDYDDYILRAKLFNTKDWRDLWDQLRFDLTSVQERLHYNIVLLVQHDLFEQLTEYNGFLTEV